MKSLVLRAAGRGSHAAFTAVVISALAASAHADPVLINGTFASSASGQFGTGALTLNGWDTSGYNFLFQPGVADTTGANGSAGHVTLWAPADSSPAGGNFL